MRLFRGHRSNSRVVLPFVTVMTLMSTLYCSSASSQTYKTAIIDGNCGEWSAVEKFPGNDSTETWVTWDASHIYFAWWGGGPSSHRRIASIDLTPNIADTTSVMTYSGVQFPPRGIPDYIVEWQNFQVWFTYRTGSDYFTVINPPGTQNFFAPGGCAGVNFTEVRVPRDIFTTGSVTGLSPSQGFGLSSWFFDPGTNFVYGSSPSTINPSGLANRTFTHAYVFPSSDAGRSPNPFGLATDQVPVALSSWDLSE